MALTNQTEQELVLSHANCYISDILTNSVEGSQDDGDLYGEGQEAKTPLPTLTNFRGLRHSTRSKQSGGQESLPQSLRFDHVSMFGD